MRFRTVRHRWIRRTGWVQRLLVVLLITVVGSIGLSGTASAHTGLSSSNPTDGATVAAPPTAVTLTFEQPVVDIGATVMVTGPDDQQYPTGVPVVDGADVRTDLMGLGPAGTYFISYRVVSEDGHPVEGRIQFLLDQPVPPTSEPEISSVSPAPSPAGTTSVRAPLSILPEATPPTGSPVSPAPAVSGSSPQTAEVASTATSESSGSSGWVWATVVLVAALITAAAVVAVRQRRSGTSG